MIDEMLSSLQRAIARTRRDLTRSCATFALLALFGYACLAFGAFAAFLELRSAFGALAAASILCAASATIVILILALSAWRRRSDRLRRAAALPPTSLPPQNMAALFEGSLASGALGDQDKLLAAVRLGRSLTPVDIVVLALAGGFIASRRLRK